MALVTITTEVTFWTQAYFFNRSIAADGTVSDNNGTASRQVETSTVTYRGDKTAVENAIGLAQAVGHKTTLRKIDGPWWEGTDTYTSYGEWSIVMDDDEEEE